MTRVLAQQSFQYLTVELHTQYMTMTTPPIAMGGMHRRTEHIATKKNEIDKSF